MMRGWVVLGALLMGCADGEDADPPVPPAPEGTFGEMTLIFGRNCIGCHDGSVDTSGGLDLSVGAAYQALVSRPAIQVPELMRVAPGDVAGSYLWHKLDGSHLEVGGSGDAMPPYLTLSDQDLAIVQAWIEGGAEP